MRFAKSLISFTLGLRRNLSGMASNISYENAIQKLNLLQSNKASIDQARMEQKIGKRCTNIEDMENYLERIGITMSKLDTLSVIHVAGTKGKGSTSAMCESILRQHGFSTGFYSSPHLVSVCERIRLDGRVISKETFARKFHQIHDRLWASQRFEGDMPKYFAFLTVMAFHMFLEKKVDVAIVEVGIGGVVDYTNVLRKVPVVGITALGLDHTSILGSTLPEIAAAKAGIMKRGCEAYTVSQPDEAMDVLKKVARDVGCPLHIAPEYHKYTIPKGHKSDLPVDLDIFRMNASLAVQLSHAWLRICLKNSKVIYKKRLISGKVIQTTYSEIIDICETEKVSTEEIVNELPLETLLGLRLYRWPGRFQVMKCAYAVFYLDGAHTKDSMEICAEWFRDKARIRDKILIFSCTGDRDPMTLLTPLKGLNFLQVHFVVPTAYKETTRKNDNFSVLEQRERTSSCNNNANIWRQINTTYTNDSCTVHECVHDAFVSIKKLANNPAVLITGSLHLVGASLSILDPNLVSS